MPKKESLQFKYDTEKLRAIRLTMQEKGIDFDAEIMDTVNKLYEKYVPSTLKNFIDEAQTKQQSK